MIKLEAILENETLKTLWNFHIQTDHQTQASKPDITIVNERERTHGIVDFAVLIDHRLKIKRHKYLDLNRKLKKLGNIKTRVILVVIGAL